MRILTSLLILMFCGLAFCQAEAETETGQAKVKLSEGKSEEDRMVRAIESRFMNQADEWFDDGDYYLISQLLEVHVGLHPDSYELVTNLGWMYGNMQDYGRELVTYLQFKNSYLDNAEAWYPAGQFYFLKKNYKMAIDILAPTIEMEPKPHANTYRLLARAYKIVGLLKESISVYEMLVKLDPNDLAAKKNLESIQKQLAGG